ncbi:MAG TPA: zinc ribbon domain-containing protein [Pyrinomonadaceae bacterium]
MNTCEKCNNPVPAEKAFCPNCGAAMTPERERAVEYMSEEMLPTMYDQEPPAKKIAVPQPSSEPVKVKASSAPPPALNEPQHKPPTVHNRPNVAQKETLAANNNRMLYSILVAAAVLFLLSIMIVGILYMMGKI